MDFQRHNTRTLLLFDIHKHRQVHKEHEKSATLRSVLFRDVKQTALQIICSCVAASIGAGETNIDPAPACLAVSDAGTAGVYGRTETWPARHDKSTMPMQVATSDGPTICRACYKAFDHERESLRSQQSSYEADPTVPT